MAYQPQQQRPYAQPQYAQPQYSQPQPAQGQMYAHQSENNPFEEEEGQMPPPPQYDTNEQPQYPQQGQQQFYVPQQPQQPQQPYFEAQEEYAAPAIADSEGPAASGAGDKLNYSSSALGGGWATWRDRGFFLAFMGHLLVIIVLAAVYGSQLTSDLKNDTTSTTTTTDSDQKQTSDNLFIGLLVVASVIGVGFSLFWLNVMKRFSSYIIKFSLFAMVALALASSILAFATDQFGMGLFFIIMALFSAGYAYMVQSRIPFATAILTSSVQAIQEHSGPVWVVYGLSVLSVAWMALWSFTFVSVYHAGQKLVTVQNGDGTTSQTRADQTSGLQFLQVFCIFSLYWTMQTIKNIGHVTTAGVVASWWFLPRVPAPTRPAFIRAVTTSIGPICFASLLVALVETARALLRQARRDACREIADCLLGMIEGALKWFNSYALCTVAIYGEDFMSSAKRTGAIFRSSLFTALINDDLSGMVLFCGAFLAGCVAGIVGMAWGASQDAESYALMGCLAFIAGFLVAMLAMSVIQSAVSTTLVCWACDPAALNHNRPAEFGRILEAATGKYPTDDLAQYNGQQPQMA